jgi:hypothetical protein
MDSLSIRLPIAPAIGPPFIFAGLAQPKSAAKSSRGQGRGWQLTKLAVQDRASRGEASLAGGRSPAACRNGKAGSMSRPGEIFVDDLKVVVGINLVGGEDTVLAFDLEESDRDHQVAGKLEGM